MLTCDVSRFWLMFLARARLPFRAIQPIRKMAAAAGTKITWKRADGSEVPGIAFGEEGRPGVVVIQEWWGVDEDILHNAARVAGQGYRALVPDLYRGKIGVDAEEASHLYSHLDFPGAVEDIRGAAAFLRSTGSARVGAIGFCMGGALALAAAARAPEVIDCAAPFYGVPPLVLADPATITRPIQGHFGDKDGMAGFSSPADAAALRDALSRSPAAAESEVFSYATVGHAFINETPAGIARRLKQQGPEVGAHDAAAVGLAWDRVFAFFAKHLSA